jgi:hypothetical protein
MCFFLEGLWLLSYQHFYFPQNKSYKTYLTPKVNRAVESTLSDTHSATWQLILPT